MLILNNFYDIKNLSKIIITINYTYIFRNLYNTFITKLLNWHYKTTCSVIFLIQIKLIDLFKTYTPLYYEKLFIPH